ncbi:hypothetical protein BIV57_00380 [Mangrovactinospora gilvigrisea]|uniref:Uncharacterized protein n=1 Tax=Mangrovactinospora gilvigrisea TaxID=1428644 RepID=A0A1J7CI77_9ACTN|nr:hypothetical protein BIV57_00380 [Mangrovactinospora gilvigrisea]
MMGNSITQRFVSTGFLASVMKLNEETRRQLVRQARLAKTADDVHRSVLKTLPPRSLGAFSLALSTPSWHEQIAAIVRMATPPSALVQRLLTKPFTDFLPSNLRDLTPDELEELFTISRDDGLGLSWAPHADLVKDLLKLGTRDERFTLLRDRREEVFDDVAASLQSVIHSDLTDLAALTAAAIDAARAGHDQAAQALACNVLETAMKELGGTWIRGAFPEVPEAGHHKTIAGALPSGPSWGDPTLLEVRRYLVLAGMSQVFAPGTSKQDTLNRHLGAHSASACSYRPQFVVPAILLAHALLRLLEQELA